MADAIVLNTAFAAVLGNLAHGFTAGVELARQALAERRVENLLERLAEAAAPVKEAS